MPRPQNFSDTGLDFGFETETGKVRDQDRNQNRKKWRNHWCFQIKKKIGGLKFAYKFAQICL